MSMFRTLLSMSGGGGGLPSEYQQVEYIQSTGTQYINTNYFASNLTDFELDFEVSGYATNYQQLMAGPRVAAACPKVYNNSQSVLNIQLDASSDVTKNDFYQVRARLKVVGRNIYFDDVLYSTFSGTRKVQTEGFPIWLFGSAGEPNLKSAMKLYSLKIWENDTLVRHFIPCYRKSDNVIGLYEIVNGNFFTNSGSGTFLKGGNV